MAIDGSDRRRVSSGEGRTTCGYYVPAGDALVYAVSLYALDRSRKWRAGAALFKGGFILIDKMTHETVAAGMIPVIAPIGAGEDGPAPPVEIRPHS